MELRQRRKSHVHGSESPRLEFRKRRVSIAFEISSGDLLQSKLFTTEIDSADNIADHADVWKDDTRINEKTWRRGLPWWHKNRLTFYKFNQLPLFLQDNPDIFGGYRAYYSFSEIWISLFHFHNESNNIWSHMLSFVYFLTLSYTILNTSPSGNSPHLTLSPQYPNSSSTSFRDNWENWTPSSPRIINLHPNSHFSDQIVIATYLFCAMCCFVFSSLFHLHLCHSPRILHAFGCLDYSGISFLTLGSTFTVAYYLFYCHWEWQLFWLSILTICNIGGVLGPAFSIWVTPRFRPFRTLIYVISGVMGILPVTHYFLWSLISGEHASSKMLDVPPVVGFWIKGIGFSGGSYLIGASIYVARIPERIFPGYFDYVGSSHQIWHLFVFLGAYSHFYFSIWMLNWRMHTLDAFGGVCPR
ncbi:hypothetical protein HK098_004797 [Nowakowskiella sp. JEL0407]|nr:hypothetical protein HK098_004797 [Nowakowskiella sp. JEL0407]